MTAHAGGSLYILQQLRQEVLELNVSFGLILIMAGALSFLRRGHTEHVVLWRLVTYTFIPRLSFRSQKWVCVVLLDCHGRAGLMRDGEEGKRKA